MDIIREVIDEIALNGLEGTTLPGLWNLLSEKKPPLLIQDDDQMKNFIWNGILQCNQIEFWLINKDKKKSAKGSKHSKEAKRIENDDGEIISSKKLPNGWISDVENAIFGYCPGYELRENISEQVHGHNLSLSDVWGKWQENLYIVGSIELRNSALFGDETAQNLILTDCRYIFLELIGKTRDSGLIQADFCNYSMDPRSSFHYIKMLINMGLVTKQRYCFLKTVAGGGTRRLIKSNILLLKRFHKRMMTYNDILEEQALRELSSAPGEMLELKELNRRLDCSQKCFKSLRRSMYANGKIQYIKSGRVFKAGESSDAIPNTSLSSFYIQLIKPVIKDDVAEAENVDDDNDVDDESLYISRCKYEIPQLLLGIPKLQQMHWVVDSSKGSGMTIKDFGSLLCLPHTLARSVVRHLCVRGLLRGEATDKAKQRVAFYISNNYACENSTTKKVSTVFDKTKDVEQTEIKSLNEKEIGASKKAHVDKEAREQKGYTGKTADEIEKETKVTFSGGIETKKRKPVHENLKMVETPRAKRRQSMLLQKIIEFKVVEGITVLYKFILQSEKECGVKENVCRKSILRSLERMVKDGLIKKYEVAIPHADESTVTKVFYCDAKISMEDEVFKTTLNQTKFRLKGIVEKRQMRGSKKAQKDAKPSKSSSSHHASLLDFINENETVGNEQSDTDDEEYEPITGSAYQRHQYGYMPRFQRLQMLHVYLWQLVYGTSEDAALCTAAQQFQGNSTDLRKEHYGWLTNLQRLPVHRLGKGHFQVGDALAIMPLEVFIKCVGICLRSKTVEKMLADPLKRYTPLRDLPPRLKLKIFSGKLVSNYNGHFSDSLIFMTHMGVLQVSPGKIPLHRAHLNMFVSKAAKIVDTTTSEKGYSHVKLPTNVKSFPESIFKLNCLIDISKYWSDLQCICLNTRLGLMRGKSEKQIEADYIEGASKSLRPTRSLMSLKEIQAANFPLCDSTDVPPQLHGDGLGAAGFDSNFFGHLPKNWSNLESRKKHFSSLMKNASSAVKAEKRIPAPLGGFTKRIVNSVVTKASIGGRTRKRKRVFDNKIVNDAVPAKVTRSDGIETGKSKSNSIGSHFEKMKKVMSAKQHPKLSNSQILVKKEKNKGHRAKVDEVDIAAVNRKRTMRVKFNRREDAAILIARVTANLLGLEAKSIRFWPAIRDIMHQMYPESCDKTAESLSRRSRTLFKNQLTVQNFNSCLLECRTDPNLTIEQPVTKDDAWKAAFNELYPVVLERLQTRLEMNEPDEEILPESLKELKEKFKLTSSCESVSTDETNRALKRKEVILCSIEQLIHNSLISRNSSEYNPSLVFRIFNQFPEEMIDEAMLKMKKKGLITRLRLQVPRRRALPISTMTFSLSTSYLRLFELPLPMSLFKEAGTIVGLITDGRKHSEGHISNKSKENEQEQSAEVGGTSFSVENEGSEKTRHLNDKSSIEGETRTETHEDDICKESNSHHHGSASICASTNRFVYSQDSCIGGHVAGILSLFVTERAEFDLEIPDEMLDAGQSSNDDELDIESVRGTGMVTLLKRKIYSQNVEDALLVNEESNLSVDDYNDDVDSENEEKYFEEIENIVDGDDEDDDDNDDDDDYDDDDDDDDVDDDDDIVDDVDDVNCSDSDDASNRVGVQSNNIADGCNLETDKIGRNLKDSIYSRGFIKFNKLSESSYMGSEKLSTLKRSCLKEGRPKTFDVDKDVVPKKRRRVNFQEPDQESQNSQSSSNDVLEEENEGSCERDMSSSEMFQGIKRHSSMQGESESVSGMPFGKVRLDGKIRNSTHSGNLAHKLRTSSGNLLFLSHQSYIDKFAEKQSGREKFSSLSPEFYYVDDGEHGGAKGPLSIVPRRILDVKKTKLHASRITLLLHRSIDQESEHRKKHIYKSFEQMELVPINIMISLKSQPQYDLVGQTHFDETSEGNMATCCDTDHVATKRLFPNAELSMSDCEKLDRFMKTEPVAFESSELKSQLSTQKIKEFCQLMVDSFNWNEREVKFTQEVLELINNAKERGLPEKEINTVSMRYLDLRPLDDLLQMCVNFRLILRVGVYSIRYVALGQASDWCFKTSLQSLGSYDKEASKVIQSGSDVSKGERRTEVEENGKGDDGKLNGNERWCQNICKPWFKLNGEYNMPLLQKFQRSVLILIMMCPGISESAIYGQFRPILTRVALKEILEFLEFSNCIAKHISTKRKKPSLFDSTEKAVIYCPSDGDPYFTPTVDCILNASD